MTDFKKCSEMSLNHPSHVKIVIVVLFAVAYSILERYSVFLFFRRRGRKGNRGTGKYIAIVILAILIFGALSTCDLENFRSAPRNEL